MIFLGLVEKYPKLADQIKVPHYVVTSAAIIRIVTLLKALRDDPI